MSSLDLDMQNNLSEFTTAFQRYRSEKKSIVVVTMTNAKGSAPQDIGARMIVGEEGLLFGTIGGGKVENHCIQFAKAMLGTSRRVEAHTWNLQKDIGMTCGGEVSFLFENESSQSQWNITIFGAGHVAQQLTRILLHLNCKLTVVDNRQEWLDQLPQDIKLTKRCEKNMSVIPQQLPRNSYLVLMTMGHASDVPILNEALKQDFPYLGVIGSKSKRNAMEKELIQLGQTAENLKSFICPIGEPIGSNDPAEIAISITAQLLKVRDQLDQ